MRFDLSTERRRGKFNLWRGCSDLNRLRCFPYLHRDVELLLSTYREGDARDRGVKALSRDLDLISPRCQVRSRIVARRIRHNILSDASGSIPMEVRASGMTTPGEFGGVA